MNITSIKSALYTWANANAGGATVVWSDQAAPRPARPYCAIKIMGIYRVSGQDEERSNAPGIPIITGHRRLVLSVRYHGTEQNALNMNESLSKPTVLDILKSSEISVINEGEVINLTEYLETGFDSLFVFDVEFLVTTSQNDTVGYIESTEIDGLGQTINISV